MRQIFYLTASFLLLLNWSSCRDNFDFIIDEGNLSFSKDTVYLDTVFTNIGSSTYTLKVYNNSENNIIIPKVKFRNGLNSKFRLNIDGLTGDVPFSGNEFSDVELLARDSMYVFIETTINIHDLVSNESQYLYTDAIEFGINDIQSVELITLVKDAIFIYPQQTINNDGSIQIETLSFDYDEDGIVDQTNLQGRFLSENELNFTSDKPYVIYGYAAVDNGDVLNIDPGTRVHFHSNSGLIITNNASIHANGSLSTDQNLLENEIIFQSDRLEPSFEEIPGQWQTIWLFNGSTNNIFNYTTIKNSTVGILCDGDVEDENKVTITNTKIYNNSNFGILARETNIKAENLVINNCGESSFAITSGGKYDISHATIVNYWTNSFRQFPSLLINNFRTDSDDYIVPANLINANFTNCIIYGNDNPELLLDHVNGADFNFKFKNCLILFDDLNNVYTSPYYNFSDSNLFSDVIFNQDPDFLDPTQNKLQISNNSPAASSGTNIGILNYDILGNQRNTPPDIGAYNAEEISN